MCLCGLLGLLEVFGAIGLFEVLLLLTRLSEGTEVMFVVSRFQQI